MEKLIFLIIVIAISAFIDAVSKKKDNNSGNGGMNGSGDNFDIEEFDFSKIAKKRDGAQMSARKQSEPVQDYAEIKHDYDRDYEHDHSHGQKPQKTAEELKFESIFNQPDAYSINIPSTAEVVKGRKETLEASKAAIKADTDSETAMERLSAQVASGAVVDLKNASIEAERKESLKSRAKFKKQSSSAKSNAAEISTNSQAADEEAPDFSVSSLFSGKNIKNSILASIILDKPKF